MVDIQLTKRSLCSAKGTAVVGGSSKLMKHLPKGEWMSYSNNDYGSMLQHYSGVTRLTQTDPLIGGSRD